MDNKEYLIMQFLHLYRGDWLRCIQYFPYNDALRLIGSVQPTYHSNGSNENRYIDVDINIDIDIDIDIDLDIDIDT